MNKENELIKGKRAKFAHCDMGEIEVEIKGYAGFGDFYTAQLLKVYLKNVRIPESAMFAKKMLSDGGNVDVFVQPSTLIQYVDSKFN